MTLRISLLVSYLSDKTGGPHDDDAMARLLGWHRNPTSGECRDGSVRWSPPDSWGGGPWGAPLPKWTTSLDAALPWENIIESSAFMHKGGRVTEWLARHRDDDGHDPYAVGLTRTLAERSAAIMGTPERIVKGAVS